jgi:hypothetical protein
MRSHGWGRRSLRSLCDGSATLTAERAARGRIQGLGVAALVLAVSACGGSGPSTPTTPAAFCGAWNQLEDATLARCYGGAAKDYAAGDSGYCALLDALVAKGTISFDSSKAADCLAQARDAMAKSCYYDARCYYDVLAGQIANGGACTDAAECPPGSECVIADAYMCHTKMCAPVFVPPGDVVAKEGEPCALGGSFATCELGLGCQPDGSGGGVCRLSQQGSACQISLECPLEDYCDGTCKPRRAVGAPCLDHDDACVLRAVCDSKSQSCKAAGGPGEPCGTYGYCLVGSCTVNLATLTCLVDAPVGTPCTDVYQCASGLCINNACAACPP